MGGGESKGLAIQAPLVVVEEAGSRSRDSAEPGETSGIRPRGAASAFAADPTSALSREHFIVLSEARKNPRAAEIEARSAQIAEDLGLLKPQLRKKFDAFNCLVGHVYPTAEVEPSITCAMWCNWLFFFDDDHDEDLANSSDPVRVRRQMEHYLGMLYGQVAEGPRSPFERLTIAFRERALAAAGRAWLLRFCDLVGDYLFKGVLPAVNNWRTARVPPLDEYLEQREHDSAVLTTIDLIEVAHGIVIPEKVRNSPDVVAIRKACTLTVGGFNDIVSYPKEVLRFKNPNNLVHVLAHEHGCSVRDALHLATDIVNDAAYEQLRLERRIFATLPPDDTAVRNYLRAMREWQRGNIEYSMEGGRYDSNRSPLVELCRPNLTR